MMTDHGSIALSDAGASGRKISQQTLSRACLALVAPGLLVLGACTNSSRFSNNNPFAGSPPRVVTAPVDDIVPYPTNSHAPEVISSPLPPTAGMVPGLENPNLAPMPGGSLTNSDPTLNVTSPGAVASLGGSGQVSAPPPVAAPSRTSMTGNWRAAEAAGDSCNITLSSAPSLDLYKASTSGCASQDLKAVNAWDLRGNEVYLYSRGSVVARLRGSGSNFNGVLAKSGAPVKISR